ncbi:MAG TPA: hypothetical protein PKJ16_08000 [Spirochaetota bacterium]|mgnify:FL=1|nr:hypothetical protein [Spirochaetota bacterium]HOS38931.1 hypothetical protein [Spirochaetota bacterium]HPU87667.1 hypothetical protein [Spirochaetota bacterium]
MKISRLIVALVLLIFMVSPLLAERVMNTTDKIIYIQADIRYIGFTPGKVVLVTGKEFKSKGVQKAIKDGKLKVVSK